jgi:hypothetical protein
MIDLAPPAATGEGRKVDHAGTGVR